MIPRAAPDLGDLNPIKRFLDFFLDPRFIAREQHKLRTLSGKKDYWVLMPVETHPAIAILECVNHLIKNDPIYMPQQFQQYARDLMVLSLTASTLFEITNNDLNNLGPPGFIKKVRDRILDQRGFFHVLYELQIAAIMNSADKTVRFEDVSDKKWPDPAVFEGELQYYLECKSLESPKLQYALLTVEINRLLETMKINADIEILLNSQPSDSASIKSIVAQIQSML